MIEGSRKSDAALAKATFVFSERNTVLPPTERPRGTITHLAADASARETCFAESTKIRSLEDARSAAATPLNSSEPSPSTAAPIAALKSFAVYFIPPPNRCCAKLFTQVRHKKS